MFSKVLIANRGEIAVRIAHTCRRLGVASVAVHSDVDARARHVEVADEAVALDGVAPVDTYLNAGAVIEAAASTGAEAVHPGYGFLSEDASFAEAVTDAGLVWVGPPPEVLRAVGDKISARRTAEHAGVPVVPGVMDEVADADVAVAFGERHGWPVAIKAAGGGGGRGLRVAYAADEVAAALDVARREARAYFGSSAVYLERYLTAPKHLEVQVLAPHADDALWLGVRDCSLQRRHQKVIEETPPPRFVELAEDMGGAAVAMSKASRYVNAGTFEFLVDRGGAFYFLEVNARLQVEHTVTEEVFDIDLVECQLKIAAGEALGLSQDDLSPRGHAIECRINAEDPARSFAPTPGRIDDYVEPQGIGIRVDSGYRAGDEVPAAYDSLIAKLITRGRDREHARRAMTAALQQMRIDGVTTTIPALLALLEEPSFVEGTHTTTTLERSEAIEVLASAAAAEAAHPKDVLMVEGRGVRLWNPAMAASAAASVRGGSTGEVVAPMQGTVLKVLVAEGDPVQAGDGIVVLEAMKMETTIQAPIAGKVTRVSVSVGDAAASGQVVAVVQ